jgi:hypothetical protein
VTEAPPTPSAPSDAGRAPAEQTLSQLAARILDQLSVSAWLPAAALVGFLLVIGTVAHTGGDVGDALRQISQLRLAAVILLIAAAIVGTIFTQAFQFEAIQLFEGYWGPRRFPRRVREWRTARHVRRRDALIADRTSTTARAWASARAAMLADRRVGMTLAERERDVAIVGRLVAGEQVAAPTANAIRLVKNWHDYAPAAERRHLGTLRNALSRYPKREYLVQPTRFGNVLRAYEEHVHVIRGDEPLERFIQQIRDRLPSWLVHEHDQLRARLDLYCTLVLVFVVAGAASIPVLLGAGVSSGVIAGAVISAFAGSWIAYRAAVTSARAYGTLLTTIAETSAGRTTSGAS